MFIQVTKRKVTPAGLHVCEEYPFLAASPDGYVGLDRLIEVKCPFSAKDDTISSDSVGFINDVNQMKKDHHYYDQIQGQLFIANKSKCHLVIYTFKDFRIIDVDYDKVHVAEKMLPKLCTFYHEHMLPFLMNRM